jgi:hypothetical protein
MANAIILQDFQLGKWAITVVGIASERLLFADGTADASATA